MRPVTLPLPADVMQLEINMKYNFLDGICSSGESCLAFLLLYFRPCKGGPHMNGSRPWERKQRPFRQLNVCWVDTDWPGCWCWVGPEGSKEDPRGACGSGGVCARCDGWPPSSRKSLKTRDSLGWPHPPRVRSLASCLWWGRLCELCTWRIIDLDSCWGEPAPKGGLLGCRDPRSNALQGGLLWEVAQGQMSPFCHSEASTKDSQRTHRCASMAELEFGCLPWWRSSTGHPDFTAVVRFGSSFFKTSFSMTWPCRSKVEEEKESVKGSMFPPTPLLIPYYPGLCWEGERSFKLEVKLKFWSGLAVFFLSASDQKRGCGVCL